MSLKIDIASLLQEIGRTIHLQLEENLTWPDDGLDVSGPVFIEADLLNSGETVILKAKINTKVKLECSRCLEKFLYPLKFKFEEEYSDKFLPLPKKKGDSELTNDDFIFKIDKDNTIDLGEAIRQNMLTQLPIKPLCSKCPEQGGK